MGETFSSKTQEVVKMSQMSFSRKAWNNGFSCSIRHSYFQILLTEDNFKFEDEFSEKQSSTHTQDSPSAQYVSHHLK